jgi:U1 small nuclear ribonucleoprotein
LDPGADLKKKKPKQPYTGIADYVAKFAAPGDPEYDPPPPSNRPPEPRLCKNPELPLQARLDTETKAEKKIRLTQWKKEEVRLAMGRLGPHGCGAGHLC